MSKKALELLKALFAENSNLQLPVGTADQVVEIRDWVHNELKEPVVKLQELKVE